MTDKITIHGMTFTKRAADRIEETGIDPRDDRDAVRVGDQTRESLLSFCLDGVDEDDSERRAGWDEYVDSIVQFAGA